MFSFLLIIYSVLACLSRLCSILPSNVGSFCHVVTCPCSYFCPCVIHSPTTDLVSLFKKLKSHYINPHALKLQSLSIVFRMKKIGGVLNTAIFGGVHVGSLLPWRRLALWLVLINRAWLTWDCITSKARPKEICYSQFCMLNVPLQSPEAVLQESPRTMP